MVPEALISELTRRLRDAAGDNLRSVVLYGSAAGGEFHIEFSNLNLLCVLHDTSFSALTRLSGVTDWWIQQKHPAPLVLTREELECSTDVFAIEFLDMREHYRLLFGEDVLANLQVPLNLHRAQIEYELREKTILLRERVLTAGNDPRVLWDLLMQSLPSFMTLFRHVLISQGERPGSKREVLAALSTRMAFDTSSFTQLLDIREGKAASKQFDVADLFGRYLKAIEQVTSAVDKMWAPAAS